MQGRGYVEEEEGDEVGEPTGEANEGEYILGLIEQMERDDLETDEAPEYDMSYDEDDALVPIEWNNLNFDNLMVNEGNQVA